MKVYEARMFNERTNDEWMLYGGTDLDSAKKSILRDKAHTTDSEANNDRRRWYIAVYNTDAESYEAWRDIIDGECWMPDADEIIEV